MAVSNESFQVTHDELTRMRARVRKLEDGLRDVVENCTLAHQGHATSQTYRAIGLLAAKALSQSN